MIEVAGSNAVKLPPTAAERNRTLKKIVVGPRDNELMIQALASLDSFKGTKIFVFLEMAKDALDELYDKHK